MNIYAIGDLHLSHISSKPMEVFGEHWKDHVSQIRHHWEAHIKNDDIVLILGDISWAMRLDEAKIDLDWLDSLPGKKICIRGNHDYWWDRPKKLQCTYPNIVFLQNTAYSIGEITLCGVRGWNCPNLNLFTEEDERLFNRELIRLKLSLDAAVKQGAREIWVMIHYPPTYGSERVSPVTQLLKKYPVTRVIYGHLHDEASWRLSIQGQYDGILYQLVSADYLHFNPLILLSDDKKINTQI